MSESIVKPLEWHIEDDRPEDMPQWNALGPMNEKHSVFKAWLGSKGTWGFVGNGQFHTTEQKAKDAVQADYEQRILSALSPSIASLQAENERLKAALKPFAQIADIEHRAKDGETVMVNVSRCRDARAALGSNGHDA